MTSASSEDEPRRDNPRGIIIILVRWALVLTALVAMAAVVYLQASTLNEGGVLKWSVRILGIAVFASIMPATAWSYYRFRIPRKKDEFERIREILDLDRQPASLWSPATKAEYAVSDYAIPVAFATVVTAVNAAILVLGEDLRIDPKHPTLLFFQVALHAGP